MTREKKAQNQAEDGSIVQNEVKPVDLANEALHENSPETATPNPQEPQAAARPANSTGHSLWRALVFLFKLGLTLAILGGLGLAVYFGLPVVYARYIQPVQDNTARVTILENNQQQAAEQIGALQTQQAAAAANQTLQDGYFADLKTRMDTAEGEISSQSTSVAGLEKIQATLQAQGSEASTELDRQIKVLKGMELLSRARLFLYQSNFGLAKQDLQSARGILAAVEASGIGQDVNDLTEVVNRLDMAIARLPEYPVAASDDLDIAWLVLMQGIPQIPAPTSTAASATITVTPTIPATPEPGVTPSPTSTP
jgi:hypothetical protein